MFEPLEVNLNAEKPWEGKKKTKKHPAIPETSVQMKNVECVHIFSFFFSSLTALLLEL